MHITVAGKQVETGEALRAHVTESLEAIAAKYFDHALEAHVTFRRDAKGRNGAFFACDINLHAGRGLSVRGEGIGHDAHRAFDEAAEHVAKRLRRYRRRMNEHARSLAEEREAIVERARQAVLAPEPEEEDEAPAPEPQENGAVIAEQPTEIARLTVREAVMRMDLAQQPVLMFRNKGTGRLNVVYRREDGNIGWIDPLGG
ncbi:MAG: ribosome-associated translation inhibitor RaiA [Acetobacteraceae bacterium]|nr:ribosome-associated translation inhibitor RaiA [Acetobacteraceae bacterium]MDW8399700.1 ribosome-associated translation inhibitor RaiA [Acetobacteraceae bacterium]